MNNCLFLSGFTLGIFTNLYYKQILNLIYKKSKPKTKSNSLKINFICKITDKQLFDEYFPKCIIENLDRWDYMIIPDAAFRVEDLYRENEKY